MDNCSFIDTYFAIKKYKFLPDIPPIKSNNTKSFMINTKSSPTANIIPKDTAKIKMLVDRKIPSRLNGNYKRDGVSQANKINDMALNRPTMSNPYVSKRAKNISLDMEIKTNQKISKEIKKTTNKQKRILDGVKMSIDQNEIEKINHMKKIGTQQRKSERRIKELEDANDSLKVMLGVIFIAALASSAAAYIILKKNSKNNKKEVIEEEDNSESTDTSIEPDNDEDIGSDAADEMKI
ncbi:MAG: hypothetical protein MHMPM18_003011 [Marteilia pararefringens]